jgi:hypothetical protein
MEPDHWAMYLEIPGGIMIEPIDRTASDVTAGGDSLKADAASLEAGAELQQNWKPGPAGSRVMRRDIELYFATTTFFGEDLLGEDVPHLMLVMSREQQTVARVAWKLNASGTD